MKKLQTLPQKQVSSVFILVFMRTQTAQELSQKRLMLLMQSLRQRETAYSPAHPRLMKKPQTLLQKQASSVHILVFMRTLTVQELFPADPQIPERSFTRLSRHISMPTVLVLVKKRVRLQLRKSRTSLTVAPPSRIGSHPILKLVFVPELLLSLKTLTQQRSLRVQRLSLMKKAT